MTITIGTGQFTNGQVIIMPPNGFNNAQAVRLTNYTNEVIILNNISSIHQGQEYLMPLMQMVYKTQNVSKVPAAIGTILGSQFQASALFCEWSDEPDVDFIGTYPTQLSAIPGFSQNTNADYYLQGITADQDLTFGATAVAPGLTKGNGVAISGATLTIWNSTASVVHIMADLQPLTSPSLWLKKISAYVAPTSASTFTIPFNPALTVQGDPAVIIPNIRWHDTGSDTGVVYDVTLSAVVLPT